MALVHCDPFAHYSTAQLARVYPDFTEIGGTISVGAFGRDSGPGMRFDDYQDAARRLSVTGVSGAVAIQQCDFRISAAPGTINGLIGVYDGTTEQCTLVINTDRTLSIYRGGAVGTLLGTSTYVVPLDTYIHVGFKTTISDAAGTALVHVWEDGDTAPQVVINLSGVDTKNSANATWNGFGIGGATSSGNSDYCNYIVMDGSGSSCNDLLGPVDLDTLFPNNRASYALNQWTPLSGASVVGMWDDTTPDDDTSYASSSTQDHQQTVAVEALPSTRPVIGAELFLCAKEGSGAPQIRPIGYQDGVANLGTAVTLGSSYAYVQQPYSALPDGTAFSTASVFNALQWGAKLTTSGDPARITQLVVVVIQARGADEEESELDVTIGDETGLNPLRETFRIQETLDAPDTCLMDIESEGSPLTRFSLGQSVFVNENGVRIFGGYITGLRERGFTGPNGGDLVVEIQATSYELNAQRRVITETFSGGSPGESLKDALTTLVNDYYDDVGVTLHPDQVDGPDLPALMFERQRGDQVNRAIAESVGYLYSIDFENRLRAWAPGDISAPDDYDADVNPELLTGDVEVEKQLQNGYANKVILVGEPIVVPDHIDYFTGDGSEDTFPLTYKIGGPIPYTADGAVGYAVVRYTADNSTESIGGLESPVGLLWEYDPIAQTIRRRGGAPGNGVEFTIQYHGLFIPNATAQDAGEIAALGLYEHVEHVTAIPDNASAQQYADALLAQKLASKDEIVTAHTRELGFHPGQTMGFECPERELTGDYLITQVDTFSEAGGVQLLRKLTLAKSENNDHDWRKVIQRWSQGSTSSTSEGIPTSTGSTTGAGLGLHATHHQSGGIDPIKLDDLATPDDNTDLNVSTSRHGLVPKITGSDDYVLTKSGSSAVWAAPTGGGSPGAGGGLVSVSVLTSGTAATYTVPGGVTQIRARLVGGGGGGGGADGGSSQYGCGAGGGGGGYAEKVYAVSPSDTFTYTIGSAGNGGTAGNNAGQSGGNTLFDEAGSVVTAGGGGGGGSIAAGTTLAGTGAGNAAGTTSGGDLNVQPSAGARGMRLGSGHGISGYGGSSPLGFGGVSGIFDGVGATGVGYGAGGGGAAANTTTDRAGGPGTAGVIIVEEYG